MGLTGAAGGTVNLRLRVSTWLPAGERSQRAADDATDANSDLRRGGHAAMKMKTGTDDRKKVIMLVVLL